MRASLSGKASRPGELVGVQGLKSVLEAFHAGLRFEMLAVTAGGSCEHDAEQMAAVNPRELLVLSEEVMASVAGMASPPPVMATVEIPKEQEATEPRSGIFLLLETMQDPGNLGTLIRSAEAFGVERVILSPGSANPWSPKVIRASAGSVFRQAMRREPLHSAIEELQRQRVRVVGAVARSEGARVSLSAELAAPIGVVIGNEGAGLSEEVLSRVDERVFIPCSTESLNAAVAGSVLLYAVLAQSGKRGAEDEASVEERRRA